MLGNIIVDQVQKTRNWPLAAAFSLVITVLSIIGILFITRGAPSKEKKAKQKKKNAKEDNYVSYFARNNMKVKAKARKQLEQEGIKNE